jgi:hypothetical protein
MGGTLLTGGCPVIIIWNGYGWLVLVLIFLCGILGTALEPLDPGRRWPRCVAMAITALVLFVLGWLLNRRRTYDPWDAPPIDDRVKHTFYWIPVEYWSGIAVLCMLIYAIKN